MRLGTVLLLVAASSSALAQPQPQPTPAILVEGRAPMTGNLGSPLSPATSNLAVGVLTPFTSGVNTQTYVLIASQADVTNLASQLTALRTDFTSSTATTGQKMTTLQNVVTDSLAGVERTTLALYQSKDLRTSLANDVTARISTQLKMQLKKELRAELRGQVAQTDLDALSAQIGDLDKRSKTDIGTVNARVDSDETAAKGSRADIDALRTRVTQLEALVGGLQQQLTTLQTRVNGLSTPPPPATKP
jgi:chromosome segregation ATPase